MKALKRTLVALCALLFSQVVHAECLEIAGACHFMGAKMQLVSPNAPYSALTYEGTAKFAARFRETWRHVEYETETARRWENTNTYYADGSVRYHWEGFYYSRSQPVNVYWTVTNRGAKYEVAGSGPTEIAVRESVLNSCEAERAMLVDFYGMCDSRAK
jgi:hypothetical protein